MREEKEKALDASVEHLKRVLAAVQEVRKGVSEASVCREFGLNPGVFRRLIFNQGLGYKGEKPKEAERLLLSPEERLYCDVFGETESIDMPFDLEESVRFVLKQLKEKERKVLVYRYWKEFTLEETGEYLDLTKERVRQIQREAVRKMRRPICANVLRFGLRYMKCQQEAKKARAEEVVSEYVAELQRKCREVISCNDVKAVRQCYEWCKEFLEGCPNADGTLIEELGLSKRASNVMKGAGIATVGDLARFKTTGDLATLRNLGKCSVEEVRKKAEDFGVIIEKSDRVTIPVRR